MDIFEQTVGKDYEWIVCVNKADYESLSALDGSLRALQWKPILVKRIPSADYPDLKPSDFPFLGSDLLVMRRKAVDALGDLLEAHGEILPLATEDDVELFVFNARMIDALDESRSVVWRSPDTNEILHVEKPAFVESAIRGLDIFRLPRQGSSTYLSERFVHRVKMARLVGLVVEKVWSTQ